MKNIETYLKSITASKWAQQGFRVEDKYKNL